VINRRACAPPRIETSPIARGRISLRSLLNYRRRYTPVIPVRSPASVSPTNFRVTRRHPIDLAAAPDDNHEKRSSARGNAREMPTRSPDRARSRVTRFSFSQNWITRRNVRARRRAKRRRFKETCLLFPSPRDARASRTCGMNMIPLSDFKYRYARDDSKSEASNWND